jgi:hypothetical protein
MVIGVPRESLPGERRVALAPAVIPSLAKAGFQVAVEAGAGLAAGYLDADYAAKGAQLAATRAEVFRMADVVLQVLCHGSNDVTGQADLPLLRAGQILAGFVRPLGKLETIRELTFGRFRSRNALRSGRSQGQRADINVQAPWDRPESRFGNSRGAERYTKSRSRLVNAGALRDHGLRRCFRGSIRRQPETPVDLR